MQVKKNTEFHEVLAILSRYEISPYLILNRKLLKISKIFTISL